MKTFSVISLFLTAIFSSFVAQAEILKFRLYEDSIEEFTPYVLTVETEGVFGPGAKLSKMSLDLIEPGLSMTLFQWNQRQLGQMFKATWNQKGSLVLKINKSIKFRAVAKTEILNPWGDTSINPKDSYSVYIDNELILSRNGAENDVRFEITNSTVEESCLWGILKK